MLDPRCLGRHPRVKVLGIVEITSKREVASMDQDVARGQLELPMSAVRVADEHQPHVERR